MMKLDIFNVKNIKEEYCEELNIKKEIKFTDKNDIYDENKFVIKEIEFVNVKQETSYNNSNVKDEGDEDDNIDREANFLECDIESTTYEDDFHEKNINPRRNINHQISSEGSISKHDNFGQNKLYICNKCEYKTTIKCYFTRHSKIHTGKTMFKCPECNYFASRKDYIRDHIKSHKGEKPYTCSNCDYASANKSSLRSHIRTHTKEKPYRCTYCEYSSSASSSLKRHIRVHTGEKPFPCLYCDYCAKQNSALKRHVRERHAEAIREYNDS